MQTAGTDSRERNEPTRTDSNPIYKPMPRRSPCPMKLFLIGLIYVGMGFFVPTVLGGIISMDSFSIDFTNPKDAESKATWASPEKLFITGDGLGWDGEKAGQIDGWIQTKPLAIGLAWRPATSVGLRVTIEPAPKPVRLNSGQMSAPFSGQVYARFSPDAKNWSTWQVLESTKPTKERETGRFFTGTLSVPQRARQEYSALSEEYSKLDVPWVDDEEALVKWIVGRDAKFFERSLSFIGYVEILFEAPFAGSQRITSMETTVSLAMSGMTRPAKDGAAKNDRSGPWRFKSP